jgi:hypothetical protein
MFGKLVTRAAVAASALALSATAAAANGEALLRAGAPPEATAATTKQVVPGKKPATPKVKRVERGGKAQLLLTQPNAGKGKAGKSATAVFITDDGNLVITSDDHPIVEGTSRWFWSPADGRYLFYSYAYSTYMGGCDTGNGNGYYEDRIYFQWTGSRWAYYARWEYCYGFWAQK